MTDSELVALEKVTRHALRLRECEGLGRSGKQDIAAMLEISSGVAAFILEE